MPGLEDFMLLKSVAEYEEQQRQERNPLFALAQGVSRGIEEERQRMKLKKTREENLATFIKNAGGEENLATNGYKIQQSYDPKNGETDIKIISKTAQEQKAEMEMLSEQNFQKDVGSGVPANELYKKYPTKVSNINDLAFSGTIPVTTQRLINSQVIENQQQIVSGQNQISGQQNIVGDEKYRVKGYDQLGRSLGTEPIPRNATQEKRDVENAELGGQSKIMIDLFNSAHKEASEMSEQFGKPGVGGRIANLNVIVAGKLGNAPAVNTFQDKIKAFASTVAKQAGEVRPTDADIERFIQAMLNLGKNDKENAINLATQLQELQNKKVNIDWATPLVQEFEKRTGTVVKIGNSGKTFDYISEYGLEQ